MTGRTVNLESAELLDEDNSNEQLELTRVAIVIATRDRHELLRRTLLSIEEQELLPGVEITLIVVDNSSEHNARELLEQERRTYRFPLNIHHEPRPGYSTVRNTGIDAAAALDPDCLVFVDDDARADPTWISTLISMARKYPNSIILGDMVVETNGKPHPWVTEAHRLDLRNYSDEAEMDHGYTANVLIPMQILMSSGSRFDERYNLSGGEDTDFFNRLLSNGVSIVFARHAIVTELYGEERSRLRWWLRRWRRTGYTGSQLELEAGIKRPLIFFKGMLRIAVGGIGVVFFVPLWLLNRPLALRALRLVMRGSGYIRTATELDFQVGRQ